MTETVLWDADRIFVVSTTPGEATVIVFPYQLALRLRGAAGSERRRLFTTMQAVLLTSPLPCWTRVCSHPVPHPSYSHELTPSDFHMFGKLNIKLRIQRFTYDDTVKSEAQKWLCERNFSIYFQDQEYLTVHCNSLGTRLVSRWKSKGMMSKHIPVLYSSPFTCLNLKVG